MDIDKLKAFYKEISKLTVDHKVINGVAAVYANDLGKALEKVNPNWWEDHSYGLDSESD